MSVSILRSREPANKYREYAVLLVLLQCVLLAKLMGSGVIAFTVAAIALLSLAFVVGPKAYPSRMDYWAVGITVLFIIKYRYAPHVFHVNDGFLYSELSHELTCACLAMQLLVLTTLPKTERLPHWYPALPGLAIVFLGDVQATLFERNLYRVGVAIVVAMLMVLASGSRKSIQSKPLPAPSWLKWILCAVPILFGLLAGATAAGLLEKNEDRIEQLLADYLEGPHRNAEAGFSGEASLNSISSWSQRDAKRVAVRVEGISKQTYLKGCAFSTFHQNKWRVEVPTRRLASSVGERFSPYFEGDAVGFDLDDNPDEGAEIIVEVWPERNEGGRFFFLPENSTALITSPGEYSQSAGGHVIRGLEFEERQYAVLQAAEVQPQFLTPELREQWLQLPRPLDSRVADFGEEVFAGCKSPSEKIVAVQKNFHNNFEYQLGVRIPFREDRLGYFLENRLPAHCEYFATATAILLRREGIPTRFVTGYVAGEKNELTGYWIARRRDAHAWVEAYDDNLQQWVLVESTPGGGVPQERTTGQLDASWQASRTYFQHAVVWFSQLSFHSVLMYGRWLLGALAVVGLGLWLVRSQRLNFRRTSGEETLSHERQMLLAERCAFDKLVQSRGLERQGHETVSQFAERILTELPDAWGTRAAAWYHEYANVRFCTASDDEIESLQTGRLELEKLLFKATGP
ncbi:MAG: transglutaminase domain-containing protein [Planctomycetaceae bacterium]|nr:transglutaminase domain-containing protein [Planctomycetaceae bacterium]